MTPPGRKPRRGREPRPAGEGHSAPGGVARICGGEYLLAPSCQRSSSLYSSPLQPHFSYSWSEGVRCTALMLVRSAKVGLSRNAHRMSLKSSPEFGPRLRATSRRASHYARSVSRIDKGEGPHCSKVSSEMTSRDGHRAFIAAHSCASTPKRLDCRRTRSLKSFASCSRNQQSDTAQRCRDTISLLLRTPSCE